MTAFELYESYLKNSISVGSETERKQVLLHAKEELIKIINALNNVFYKDIDIINNKSHNIYSLLKREIAKQIVKSEKNYIGVILYYKFYLTELLNGITNYQILIPR